MVPVRHMLKRISPVDATPLDSVPPPGHPASPEAMRRSTAVVVAALVVMLAAVAVHAQATKAVLSLPPSWGAVEVERFVETDGDPTTTEVLIWRYADYLWRIVAVRSDGTLCAGPWFSFIHDPWAWPRFKRVAGVDVAFLTEMTYRPLAQSYYFEVALEHPTTCVP